MVTDSYIEWQDGYCIDPYYTIDYIATGFVYKSTNNKLKFTNTMGFVFNGEYLECKSYSYDNLQDFIDYVNKTEHTIILHSISKYMDVITYKDFYEVRFAIYLQHKNRTMLGTCGVDSGLSMHSVYT